MALSAAGKPLTTASARTGSGAVTLRHTVTVPDELAAKSGFLGTEEMVLDRLRASGWERWFDGEVFLSHHQGMSATAPAPTRVA